MTVKGICRVCLSSAVTLTISACAANSQWYLNGKSQAQFELDKSECSRATIGRTSTGGANVAGQGAGSGSSTLLIAGLLQLVGDFMGSSADYNNCMRRLGYTPEDSSAPRFSARERIAPQNYQPVQPDMDVRGLLEFYLNANDHRAFALSADGQFAGAAYGQPDAQTAVNMAMAKCRDFSESCEIISVDGFPM